MDDIVERDRTNAAFNVHSKAGSASIWIPGGESVHVPKQSLCLGLTRSSLDRRVPRLAPARTRGPLRTIRAGRWLQV